MDENNVYDLDARLEAQFSLLGALEDCLAEFGEVRVVECLGRFARVNDLGKQIIDELSTFALGGLSGQASD